MRLPIIEINYRKTTAMLRRLRYGLRRNEMGVVQTGGKERESLTIKKGGR